MAEATPGQAAPRPLPQGLDLLWGRRERGRRGPRPGLSADAIADAAVRLADAEGLDAISMARVAARLGVTTMALYRHVTNKDELLQLMWNAGALGMERLVIEEGGWRSRLRSWAIIQRDMLDLHPWVTQMPMAAPPLGPNSLRFVERGLAAMDETGLPDTEKIRVIGLLSSFTLSEARMAADAMRAATAAMAAKPGDAAQGDAARAEAVPAGTGADGPPGPPQSFETLLRELVDEKTYPRLYRLAWEPEPENPQSEREQFLSSVETILDGVQALIDRTAGGY
jgi:AcrR family transcriptional regulator